MISLSNILIVFAYFSTSSVGGTHSSTPNIELINYQYLKRILRILFNPVIGAWRMML